MTAAEEKVNMPGTVLMIVGILTILGNLINLAWTLVSLIPSLIDALNYGADALMAFVLGAGITLVTQAISSGIGLFVGALAAYAGTKLKSLQSPGVVYAGAILSMIPCCAGGCCCLGLPAGIWVLVVMQDEEVKAAFEA